MTNARLYLRVVGADGDVLLVRTIEVPSWPVPETSIQLGEDEPELDIEKVVWRPDSRAFHVDLTKLLPAHLGHGSVAATTAELIASGWEPWTEED